MMYFVGHLPAALHSLLNGILAFQLYQCMLATRSGAKSPKSSSVNSILWADWFNSPILSIMSLSEHFPVASQRRNTRQRNGPGWRQIWETDRNEQISVTHFGWAIRRGHVSLLLNALFQHIPAFVNPPNVAYSLKFIQLSWYSPPCPITPHPFSPSVNPRPMAHSYFPLPLHQHLSPSSWATVCKVLIWAYGFQKWRFTGARTLQPGWGWPDSTRAYFSICKPLKHRRPTAQAFSRVTT